MPNSSARARAGSKSRQDAAAPPSPLPGPRTPRRVRRLGREGGAAHRRRGRQQPAGAQDRAERLTPPAIASRIHRRLSRLPPWRPPPDRMLRSPEPHLQRFSCGADTPSLQPFRSVFADRVASCRAPCLGCQRPDADIQIRVRRVPKRSIRQRARFVFSHPSQCSQSRCDVDRAGRRRNTVPGPTLL